MLMKLAMRIIIVLFIIIMLSVGVGYCHMKQPKALLDYLANADDLVQIFPADAAHIKNQTDKYMSQARKLLDELLAIPASQRTFENTVQAFDFIGGLSDLAIHDNLVGLMKELHPDEAMRVAAQKATQDIQVFWIDAITDNKDVYLAFKAYTEGNGRTEQLTPEQQYYISEAMKGFKRAGLELEDGQRANLSALKKELADLALKFETHIAQDASIITVPRTQLAGLEDDFIATLKKAENDDYILG